MNNWKIINKIALVFGIVFAVFTVLAAVINYEFSKAAYEPGAPASIFTYSYLAAMLPFLVAAVLSFTVYALSLHAAKSAAEKEPEAQEKQMQQTETQPEPEDVFTEST
jgi:large-conductance mechanosensitive channel